MQNSDADGAEPGAGDQDAAAQIAAAFAQAAVETGNAGLIVNVDGGGLRIAYAMAQPKSPDSVVEPNATLRIASNTKTFVAVAALKLVEQGRLDLDAPMAQLLPDHLQVLLRDGGYDVGAITTRMLLQHTAGLADHAQLDVYFEQIMANPQRVWSREDQVALAMNEGEAVGAPGERFAYSDTGYVLAGAIIEAVYGASLAEAVRDLSGMDALGLSATWWESLEPEPQGAPPRMSQVLSGLPLMEIHPSVDLYGGGGLVSNLHDLARFHRAAATGALFEDRALAASLITPSPQSLADGEGGYGMGFSIREYAGETCYEHMGFWGTLAVYCPGSDLMVAAAVTDGEAGFPALGPMVDAMVRAVQ